MAVLFKILLFGFVFFWLLAKVGGFFTRLFIKKQFQKFAGQTYTNGQQTSSRREGDINVDYVPKSKKNSSSSDGDYIDFEEVK